MAEQRQPFRFRLPWLAAAPQPAPSPPRPAPSTQPPAPAQRPPFRPAGSAPAQPPPPAQPSGRVVPPPPSSPSRGAQSRVSPQPASPTQISPPSRVLPPSVARGSGPQSEPMSQMAPRSPSPKSKGAAIPPQSAPKVPPTEQPTTIETSQTQEGIRKPDSEAQPIKVMAPPLEKVESSAGRKKRTDSEEPKAKAPIKPEFKQEIIKTVAYKMPSEEPKEILKGINHDEPKRKGVTGTHARSSDGGIRRQEISLLDERGQHPNEEVFEKREVSKTKEDLHKSEHKLGARRNKHPLHEMPHSVITLTGENTGAAMHLSSEPSRRERSIHIRRGYKSNPDESPEGTTDGEGKSRGRKSEDSEPHEELATTMYVNNNVQGINNSLVFNSSVSERNPGVHLGFSRNPPVGQTKPGKGRDTVETHKAEVATTPAERLTYAPSIRRRCLRGLFLESGDSEPDNPKKPRHHGCRVGCNQKGKDGTIDVL